MNKLRHIVIAICFFLFTVTSVSAQRNVNRILDYYESGAYHLTIKKINNLKAKHQSKSRIQLVLADCYWQIGNKKRSIDIYEKVATSVGIPIDFKAKYERANFEKQFSTALILDVVPLRYFEEPSTLSKVKGSIVQPFYTSRTSISKSELSSPKREVKPIGIKTLLGRINNKTKTEITKRVVDQKVEAKFVNTKSVSSESLVNTSIKTKGKYRVRIPVASNEEASTLVQYIGLKEVEIFEWAKRKIVIAGYYESPKMAQDFIDEYIKHFYSKAVVVTKEKGRYKSVDQVL